MGSAAAQRRTHATERDQNRRAQRFVLSALPKESEQLSRGIRCRFSDQADRLHGSDARFGLQLGLQRLQSRDADGRERFHGRLLGG